MLLKVKAKMDVYGHDPYIKGRAATETRIAVFITGRGRKEKAYL